MQLNKANSTDTGVPFLDFQAVLFQPKSMTNAMILILILLISRFRMSMFLVPLLVVFIFLNLFAKVSRHLADVNACNKILAVLVL